MKKITILIFFMWALWGHSQVKDYTFSQAVGTYSEISTGTSLGDAASDNQFFIDPGTLAGGTTKVGQGFPIGFNFVFNGAVYDRFGVSPDGWISLGMSGTTPNAVDMSVKTSSLALASVSGSQPANLMATIAALVNDLKAQPGASILFQTIGNQGSRTLVVQWKKYMRITNSTGDSFDFQIRLNETTNTVQIVYGNFTGANINVGFEVGLRAAPTDAATNFSNRTDAAHAGWNSSIPGTDVSNTYRMDVTDTYKPSVGQTYTWTPPSCGAVKDLVVNNITTNSAVLNWGSYLSTPSGFEYVVSTSSALPTGSGTATTATSANIGGLSPFTIYNVFMRTNCSSQYTAWKLISSFTTKCSDVTMLFEDFDSYSTVGAPMPDCWGRAITSLASPVTVSISMTAGSDTPPTAPNSLLMRGNGKSDDLGTTYAILPAVSNISTGRLKFKGYASQNPGSPSVDVGYYTDSNDVSTFHVLRNISLNVGAVNAVEYIVTPGNLPGVKNLGFRNTGDLVAGAATAIFVDDVKWEPDTTCPDVTAVIAKGLTDTSVNISWTKGTTTAWQYAYAPYSVTNPYTLTGTNVTGTNPAVQLTGLSAGTKYKVWIRSNCSGSFGAWIGPVIFETLCTPVAEFAQNFDLQSGLNVLPTCWRQIQGAASAVTASQSTPVPSSPNSLKLDSSSGQPIIVTLPPLSTTQTGTYQLKLKVKGSVAGVKLDIGYLTDITDASTFVTLTTITTGATFSSEVKSLGAVPQPYLAFRNPGLPTGAVSIDDVVWEAITDCPPVADVTATNVTSTTATLQWTPGYVENQWQYVVGTPNDINPFVLPVKNITNAVNNGMGMTATVTGLVPSATNKIWLRSKCSSSLGSWVGPLNVVTLCALITDFSQNFDTQSGVPALPSCWAQAGSTGSVSVNSDHGGGASAPYQLTLQATSSGSAVVAMPPVSNSAAGTYRLTFKYRNTNGSNSLEVGYLTNIGEPASFVPLTSFTCSTVYQDAIAELGMDPASQILAFRSKANGAVIDIDNVVWEPIPACADITSPMVTSVTDASISFAWTKAAGQTAWQYAVGPATASNTNGLTVYDVTGDPSAVATKLSASNNLMPSTSYKIWIRSKCSASSLGAWVGPISATTTCAPAANFTESFAASAVPACWTKMGTKGTVRLGSISSELNDGNKLELFCSSATDDVAMVAIPPLSSASMGDHILKFKSVATSLNAQLQVGYITNILDPSSFVLIDTFNATSTTVSYVHIIKLPASPVSNILAFRNAGVNISIFIDDVSWLPPAATRPACLTNVTATPDTTCGKFATAISWNAAADADGYLLDVSTAPGGPYVVQDLDMGNTANYAFMGNNNTTYYYTVKPYNYSGTTTGCPQLSFTTNPTPCYCISAPAKAVSDPTRKGITNIKLGGAQFINIPASTPASYTDFTAKPVNLTRGSNDLKLTFEVFYSYNTAIWIDFNNDYNFDSTEVVFTGASDMNGGQSYLPTTSVFSIPADAALGMHRMRVVSRKDGGNGDPCFNGAYGITLDFTVNIVEPVANDVPTGAIPLTVGTDFASNAVTGTNVNSTGSIAEAGLTCGNYNGSDVWYKVVMPSSENITFEINSVAGGITNTAGAVYSVNPDSTLSLLACDDSSSTAGDNHPKISLYRAGGETLYFRVWENGGDAYGSFKVSAYKSALGTDDFESANFSYYPNPVKEMLNLSYNQEISNVTVLNLLGQQMISKSLNATQGKIDLSHLSVGTYLVKVTTGNRVKTIKVVKE